MSYKVLYRDLNNRVFTWSEEEIYRKEIVLQRLIRDVIKIKGNIEDIYIKEDNEIIEIKIPDFGEFYIIPKRGEK